MALDVTGPACTIAYREFPIRLPLIPLRLAAHGMLVVRRGETILHVLEGLATGADGAVKAIGRVRSDSIRCYDRGLGYDWRLSLARAPGQILFAGSETDTRRRVAATLEAGAAINARDIGYPPWGIFAHLSRNGGMRGLANSNAVVSTLVRAMGLPRERPSLFAPGSGVMLLGAETIAAIRARHGLDPGEGGARLSTPAPLACAPAPRRNAG